MSYNYNRMSQKVYGIFIKKFSQGILVEVKEQRANGEGYLMPPIRRLKFSTVEAAQKWAQRVFGIEERHWIPRGHYTPDDLITHVAIESDPVAIMKK